LRPDEADDEEDDEDEHDEEGKDPAVEVARRSKNGMKAAEQQVGVGYRGKPELLQGLHFLE
jgi:hypothetical protein